MEIRPYAETDAPATLSVFLAAVTETASVHYSAEQIAAWARPDERDLNQWNSARKSANTYVATIGAEVAGFSDVGDDGYIDMMFVAPKFGRRGVAGALLAHLHGIAVRAGASMLYTNASITARPFFEQYGFAVVAEQHPITLCVEMTNYKMMLPLQNGSTAGPPPLSLSTARSKVPPGVRNDNRMASAGLVCVVREARPEDLSKLQDIEVAAGEAFRLVDMATIAEDVPPALDALAVYQQDGRAWVAANSNDEPVAYMLIDVVDCFAHIEQVSVHPRYARRGVGGLLIEEAARWAAARGLGGMTLTTFEEVPWNAPYYRRLGFQEMPDSQWSAGIRQVVQSEREHGLAVWPRVVMKRAFVSGCRST
jgi:putative acetyltransferase